MQVRLRCACAASSTSAHPPTRDFLASHVAAASRSRAHTLHLPLFLSESALLSQLSPAAIQHDLIRSLQNLCNSDHSPPSPPRHSGLGPAYIHIQCPRRQSPLLRVPDSAVIAPRYWSQVLRQHCAAAPWGTHLFVFGIQTQSGASWPGTRTLARASGRYGRLTTSLCASR